MQVIAKANASPWRGCAISSRLYVEVPGCKVLTAWIDSKLAIVVSESNMDCDEISSNSNVLAGFTLGVRRTTNHRIVVSRHEQ